MNRPIRTTVVFGLLSALLVFPVVGLLADRWEGNLGFKLALWLDLALYCVLLVRWSKGRLLPALFPLALLLGAALWPWSRSGFFLLGLGVLSWVRSGICFKAPPLRLLTAETMAMAGGAGLVALLAPGTVLSWALAIWLFFLVQALYFYIMPGLGQGPTTPLPQDPFETALQEAEKMLG
jgi:hypothetical protein